jgi:hypothetical protein
VLGSCPDSRGLDNILSSIGVGWGNKATGRQPLAL